MDSLGNNINEEKVLLDIDIIEGTKEINNDSILTRAVNTVMNEKSIAIDDSLMRSLDEDPNDTISVVITTPDTLEVDMYPKGEKGFSPKVDMSKSGGKTTLTIYDETGSHTTEILDGSGSGLDVQVNGISVIEDNVADIRLKTINNQSIVGIGNIEIQGEEGTKNYNTLQNKPKINNITLQGNLSSNDLDLQSKITADNKIDFSFVKNVPNIPTKTSELTNDSGFITKSANNLDNYYTKGYVDNITTNVNTNTSDIAKLKVDKVDADDLALVATTGNYGDLSNKPSIPNVVNNVTSIDTANALSAYQGKLLNDRINNVESRGRFLAIWNAAIGKPLTDPAELPYIYRTGDWYRVSTTAAVNYMPDGGQYDGTASRIPYTDPIATGDCFWYDGTAWKLEVNHAVEGGVQDILINGTSIVSDSSANILVDGAYSSSNKIATQSSIPTRVGQLTNDIGYITNIYHDATKQDKLANQTIYSNKGTATKVPQITTNNLGQVTNITEVDIAQQTVNDAILTIQKNESSVGTFSANASTNKTINIDVPTKTSQLTNDSDFITLNYHDNTKQDKFIELPYEIFNLRKYSTSADIIEAFGGIDNLNDIFDKCSKKIPMITIEEQRFEESEKSQISVVNVLYSYLSMDNNQKELELALNGGAGTVHMEIVFKYHEDDTPNFSVSYRKIIPIPTRTSELTNDSEYITSSYHDPTKQDILVSGTNIKTINNQSILGEGNIDIEGGEGSGAVIIYSSDSDETIMEKLKTIVVGQDGVFKKTAYYVDVRDTHKQVFPLLAASTNSFTFYREIEAEFGVVEFYVFKTLDNVLTKQYGTYQLNGLNGTSDPTENTEGYYRGQTYVNTITGEIFYLKGWSNSNPKKYYWEKFTGGVDLDKSNTFTKPQTIISETVNGIRLEDEDDDQKYANFGTSGFQYKPGTGEQSVNIPYEDIALKEDIENAPVIINGLDLPENITKLWSCIDTENSYGIMKRHCILNMGDQYVFYLYHTWCYMNPTEDDHAYFDFIQLQGEGRRSMGFRIKLKLDNTFEVVNEFEFTSPKYMGNINDLETTDTSSLVAAINEVNDKTPVIIYASEEPEETVVQKLLSCINKENNGILIKPCIVIGGDQEIYDLKRTYYSSTTGSEFIFENQFIENEKLYIYHIVITVDNDNNMNIDESGYRVNVERIIPN